MRHNLIPVIICLIVTTNIMGFLTAVHLKNNNYLFISYSHKDQDEVLSFLSRLDARYINYWYDKDLRIGERWNERVQSHISDPKCLGAIIFVSNNWLISDACSLELDYLKTHDMNVYPVFIDSGLTTDARSILRNELDIDDNVLYATNNDASADQLLRTLIDTDVDVVNNYEAFVKKMEKKDKTSIELRGESYYIKLGKYPQKKFIEYPPIRKDEVFADDIDDNILYLQASNTDHAYEFENIWWRLIDATRTEVVLIMSNSLFSCLGTKEEISKELQKFIIRAKLDNYDTSLMDDVFFNKYKDKILLSNMLDSNYVLESYRHEKYIYFYNNNGRISLLNQSYNSMDGGVLSPFTCYGSPILVLTIHIETED